MAAVRFLRSSLRLPGRPHQLLPLAHGLGEDDAQAAAGEAMSLDGAIAANRALRDVRFDEYGTPDRKLPDCPRCGEDELHICPFACRAHCLRCNWECMWTRRIDA